MTLWPDPEKYRLADSPGLSLEAAKWLVETQQAMVLGVDNFEMLIGQVGENGDINVVLGKPLRVLGHAKLFQPVPNFLHRGHQGPVVAEFWTTAIKSVHKSAIPLLKKAGQSRMWHARGNAPTRRLGL
jgi:hypothetical protein